MRADRFVAGFYAGRIEDGTIRRLLKRLQALYEGAYTHE
ncbi:DUF6508 domain-containing protein [Paenibacillus sp. J2TS4]